MVLSSSAGVGSFPPVGQPMSGCQRAFGRPFRASLSGGADGWVPIYPYPIPTGATNHGSGDGICRLFSKYPEIPRHG